MRTPRLMLYGYCVFNIVVNVFVVMRSLVTKYYLSGHCTLMGMISQVSLMVISIPVLYAISDGYRDFSVLLIFFRCLVPRYVVLDYL